jgi:hypothetical protein
MIMCVHVFVLKYVHLPACVHRLRVHHNAARLRALPIALNEEALCQRLRGLARAMQRVEGLGPELLAHLVPALPNLHEYHPHGA